LIIHGATVRVIGVVAGIVRKFGFEKPRTLPGTTESRPAPSANTPTTNRRPLFPGDDSASLDLAVNVMDSQLVRWQAAIARAKHDKRLRRQVPQMEEMSRNLQAVRDWCARTRKPSLRRALVNEANRIMRRMQRFATVTPVQLTDLVLH
jgi:hypothetical protein